MINRYISELEPYVNQKWTSSEDVPVVNFSEIFTGNLVFEGRLIFTGSSTILPGFNEKFLLFNCTFAEYIFNV